DAFLRSGRVEYASDEVVPDEWSVNRHRPERLTADRLQSLLASGANYYAARAVAAFFSELQRDYTELLVACREEIPICHNTLHMIRTYAALRRNPRLVLWCRAHREKAEAYADNGVAYQRQYLHRIDEIEGFVQA
ncbi:MAG: SGNH/GDSL hydrolase family protein, partial [Desulfovibrionaceae bacterium]